MAGPMKVLVKSPYSMFSGYGQDGYGLVRALRDWGADVYVQPTWLDVPIPKDLLHLFTKPLVAPFDLTINHWDPANLNIEEPARRATGLAVAWTMWEFCVTDSHEAFTKRGWMLRDRLVPGEDEVLGVNPATGLAEWQIVEAVNAFPGRREMVCYDFASHSSCSTLSHRWLVRTSSGSWSWRKTTSLRTGDSIPRAVPLADLPAEPKYSDAFVELVAWTYTEGWLEREASVRIGQNERVNPAETARIRAALIALCGPAQRAPRERCVRCSRAKPDGCTWRWIRARGLCSACYQHERVRGALADWAAHTTWAEGAPKPDGMVIFSLSRPVSQEILAVCPGKVPSMDFLLGLTRAQLELFIEVSLLADGTEPAVGKPSFTQCRGPRLEAFIAACVLAGKSTGRPYRSSHDHIATVLVGAPVFVAPERRAYEVPSVKQRIQHEGVVWCPTVRLGNWLARHKGSIFFTGNSPSPGPAQVMKWAPDGKSKVPVTVQPKPGALYPLCRNRSTFTKRMKWYDLLLGYDPVTMSALEPLLPPSLARGTLLGGYDAENWRPVQRDWHGDQFGFAMHGALNNRKQPYLVLQAHLELREEDQAYRDQARLSFHTTMPPLFPELNEILTAGEDRRVRVFMDTWDDATLKQFYAANHCLVYPSQGEGKNVPCLEFLSTGGTVIHTKRGGPEMWLNDGVGYELPFVLRPVDARHPDGAHSARVELADLKRVMLQVFQNRGEARMKGELASQLIPRQLDWQVVVSDLFRRIRDLCGRQGEILWNMSQECHRDDLSR